MQIFSEPNRNSSSRRHTRSKMAVAEAAISSQSMFPQPHWIDTFAGGILPIVGYEPDANVLAEAISAEPDWFVTHDKEHFLKRLKDSDLVLLIGTPGDLIQSLKDDFRI